jgi:membrane fusion protein (multidrug efflux system)
LAIGVAIYAVFGQVNEYAAGPAIIRLGERADLTSITAGTVVNVLVRAGEAVKAGQILVQFYSAQESAELAQSDREFELELVNLLRDPSNQDARQSMARLRSERDRRLARLEERSMRTPIEGTVSDIRITPGQHLETGDPVMSVLGRSSRRLLIAMLPGYYRPLLRSGLPIRLELTGYPYVHQDLSVSKIGDEIVGPAAVRRYLGRDFADAVPLTGAAVLVYSELPGGGFVWEDRERVYFDGMQGRVRVKVRTQSALLALIPGLRKMIGSHAD